MLGDLEIARADAATTAVLAMGDSFFVRVDSGIRRDWGLASASRTARCVIALPRKLALYMHTVAASEGSKNTEDAVQKEEGKSFNAGA